MSPNYLYDNLFAPHERASDPFLLLSDGTSLNYDEFIQTSKRYAHALQSLGLQPDDRMAVQVAKSPEALALYATAIQAGVIFLPLNPAYTTAEVTYFLENSGAKLLICDGKDEPALSPIATAHSARCFSLNADGTGGFASWAEAQPSTFTPIKRGPDDLAAFLYTSGTTGRSKGAMLTHRNLVSNAETLAQLWQFTPKDCLLHALPIFHTHGLFVATNVILSVGARMIFLPKFDVDQVMDNLSDATTMMGVPTFYTRLLEASRFTSELTKDMRLFISGSAPLLAETHDQFADRTGHRILERYGMTETNMNTSNPYDGERRAGTVGFALPDVELKITNPDDGSELPLGEIGLIEVRGPNVFKGYWKMPDKTAAELREDGFFITGDLGRIDEDGYVHIVGRNKDLIISGGYNIYPKEIEMVLDDQPGVKESAVIGVPHPDFGETPLGVLVAEAGVELNLDDLLAQTKETLAGFKCPKKLITLSELPRNTMGKVQKNVLRDSYKDLFQG